MYVHVCLIGSLNGYSFFAFCPPLVLICVVMYMCTMCNNYYNFCIHIRVCMCVYHNVNSNGYLCSVCVCVLVAHDVNDQNLLLI